MSVSELFLIAVGLSMDAFAVAVCKGLANKDIRSKLKKSITIALYFGIFQALMPLIGFFLGSQFRERIESIDHWIAFVLLAVIGGKMIWESFGSKSDSDSDYECDVCFKTMLPLAVATSIDALAVGITFAFLQVSIVPAISFIGIITFILSLIGVEIGKILGHKFCSKAEFAGGAILILIGTKTLLEHLGIINF